MIIGLREMKAAMLALLIVAALCLKGKRAEAAEPEMLVVAGGCFWCVEVDFEKVRRVIEAESGFAGGAVENPSTAHDAVALGGGLDSI